MKKKLTVFLDISFKSNDELEKRIKATLKRPFKLDIAGDYRRLDRGRLRDHTYVAKVTPTRITGMRRMAYTIRRWKGVNSVGFSLIEEIPLTRGPAPSKGLLQGRA